jgi:hypothetical protein
MDSRSGSEQNRQAKSYNERCEVAMAQMTPQVSKLPEQAFSLSVEEQEALADSRTSSQQAQSAIHCRLEIL